MLQDRGEAGKAYIWPYERNEELVLFIGNYLNAGHNKGQSFGFDVDFLPKLRDSKSADNSQTMLHFMANMIENNSEYAMIKGFEEDLRYLPMNNHDL